MPGAGAPSIARPPSAAGSYSSSSPTAILIDATIVRAVVLPATMKLLGKHNWYLPKGLGWLPKFEPEPAAVPAAA